MARRVSIPHHQVGRAVPGLRARHVELEYGHPYLVPGSGAGFTIHRISGSRDAGRGSLQVIPARGVLRQRVVRSVQPTTARVSYPEFTPFVLGVLDRFDIHKVYLNDQNIVYIINQSPKHEIKLHYFFSLNFCIFLHFIINICVYDKNNSILIIYLIFLYNSVF